MKIKDEIKTEECSQCRGKGYVLKVYSFAAIKSDTQCPVCDGYGFVIVESQKKVSPLK